MWQGMFFKNPRTGLIPWCVQLVSWGMVAELACLPSPRRGCTGGSARMRQLHGVAKQLCARAAGMRRAPNPTAAPATPPLIRYWVVLLLPYHICCRVVCWFYRNSSGENVFDMVGVVGWIGGLFGCAGVLL